MGDMQRARKGISSASSARITIGAEETGIRVFPAAGSGAEVIGEFQRFGDDAQPFEVVTDLGETNIRPRLPAFAPRARARFRQIEDENSARKAA